MKKKLIAIMVVLVLSIASVFTVTACNKTEGKFTADVFIYNYADTYISTVRASLKKELDNKGVASNFYDAANDQGTQTDQIDTAISKGSDLLIVNLVDTSSEDAAKSIVTKAEAAGIPVVFFNREPSANIFTTSYAESTAFVGTNYVQAGYMQGEMIAKDLIASENDKGDPEADLNGDNKITYVMMRGEMANNEAIARTLYSVLTANKILKDEGKDYQLVASTKNVVTGTTATAPSGWEFSYDDETLSLSEAITKYCGGVNPLASYSVDANGSWSSSAAQNMMETMLGGSAEVITGGTIEIAICNNDGMAEGVISALYTVDYNKGGEKSIPVYGVDATDAAKELIRANKMTGSIAQDGQAMASAIAFLAKNVEKEEKLMADTADKYIVDGAKSNNIRIPYAIFVG